MLMKQSQNDAVREGRTVCSWCETREEGERINRQVRGRGRGAHFSVCIRCKCHGTLVDCLIFIFLYTETTQLSFSAVFCFVFLLVSTCNDS